MSDGRGPLIIAVVGRHNVGKTTVGTRMVEAWTEMGLLVAALKHDGHADDRRMDRESRFDRSGDDSVSGVEESSVEESSVEESSVEESSVEESSGKESSGKESSGKESSGKESSGKERHSPAARPRSDDWEKPGSDTERLVTAGAAMTMIVGGGQTLLRTTRDTEADDVYKLLSRLEQHANAVGPALDIILVEGYKYTDLPKVVVIGPEDRECLLNEAFTSVQAVIESPLWEWRESQRLGKTLNLSNLPAKTLNASFTQKHLPVYHGNNLRDLCRSLWYTHIRDNSL
ncbi:molybdopterin-guanine dinucleotide biosynthesis protein B [Alicyclobacillus ferrooxydans]|uniref:Molybdopterin-guanine dinucleotide biosynthesis protein B (MobB) domain-containing protein n=1 Tax=Alicyclobacillus ferrooxydans TaxID=471514 RepID=A0A0P9CGY8_9BACL|nr:molybdopterin-guanine dinucleotide biosynthesis protein MobB [Alicyclobacillus ferrooxydans]KPV45011.1 hypothetical protein AN477_04415 [Alicyclobacillus ferrooxydans]